MRLDTRIQNRLLAVFKELGGEELQRPQRHKSSRNDARTVIKREDLIRELRERFRMDSRCLVLSELGREPLLSKDYEKKAPDASLLKPLSTTIIAAMLRVCHSTVSIRGRLIG